ncbi:MAG: beta-propeller domain-containing protein [Candidatus Omnitrophica bacterium]|nr:beta-propeller domain-containing protein [Candidatus Omnitrophota bacterium]
MKKISLLLIIFSLFFLNSYVFAEKNILCDPKKLIRVKYGQYSNAVKNLQSCLIKLGFDIPSGATGYYGKQTLNAVKEFYKTWYGDWHGYYLGPQGIKKLKELTSFKFTLTKIEFKKFSSRDEFKNYLLLANAEAEYFEQYLFLRGAFELPISGCGGIICPQSIGGAPERISETTVQVKGVDEPDIVKTDGINIYFSQSFKSPIMELPILCFPEMKDCSEPLKYSKSKTKIIKAFPPDNLNSISSIDNTGELLLLKDKKILVILNGNKIYGYDVSNSENPKEKWNLSLEEGSLFGARLYKDKIYLAFRNRISVDKPYPIKPLSINNKELIIDYKEIYHPNIIVPVDLLFHVIAINPIDGKIENKISFLGSEKESVLYMSPNNIYITYSYIENFAKHLIDFLIKKNDSLPASIKKELEKLKGYDSGDGVKISEIQNILENYVKSLNPDERLKFTYEIENELQRYYDLNKRDIEKTIIIKINIEKFDISSVGSVPGSPLNQFSLDEYKDNLRIAVTIGGRRFSFWGVGVREQSMNDAYILDKNLKILSSVQDLGKGERIYSVRFIEDKGYIVTFRETDPFYVLDLKDPVNPKLKGELKIPGYSSYLHPITKEKILGVGKEDWNLKISLFDVTNPESPLEKDKYILDEYWSEVLDNFHAFLLDDKHQIFFLPASQGGYIFSYKDDKLSLVKTISDFNVKRAIYLDDYLYIIGENKIKVLNELNWEVIKELSF